MFCLIEAALSGAPPAARWSAFPGRGAATVCVIHRGRGYKTAPLTERIGHCPQLARLSPECALDSVRAPWTRPPTAGTATGSVLLIAVADD
jgi:hypothetical protein